MENRYSTVRGGLLVLAAVLGASEASGQSLIRQFAGGAPGEQLGNVVALVPDVDGDGLADAAASSPTDASGFGVVRVFSGATGALLWSVQGPSAGTQFGASLAGLRDVDGDGRGDVAVGTYFANFAGAPGAGSVRIYSGATGALIREHRGDAMDDHMGWSVADAGDVDGDGVDDVIAGAVDTDAAGDSAGSARIWSGATGMTLLTIQGSAATQLFGYSVAGAGDVDGDGHADVIIGGPYFQNSAQSGMARVHSGANGGVLLSWTGSAMRDQFGATVAGLGDVDGDGVPDVIVGAKQVVPGAAGYARVLSGANGALIYQVVGDTKDQRFGTAVARAGDVDYDGRMDFLVATPVAAPNGVNSGLCLLYTSPSPRDS